MKYKKVVKTLIAFLALFASLTANAQQKTWSGTTNLLYPNMATNTFVLDKSGANTMTVNKDTASSPGDTLLRLQQQGTNVWRLFNDGGMFFGNGAESFWGDTDPGRNWVFGLDEELGDTDRFDFFVGSKGYGQLSIIDLYTSSSYPSLTISHFDSPEDIYGTYFISQPDKFWFRDSNGYQRLFFAPSYPDGTTPYTLDTAVPHTTGSLLDVKNNGTNVFTFYPNGSIATGISVLDFWGEPYGPGFVAVKEESLGEDTYWEYYNFSRSLSGMVSEMDLYGNDGYGLFSLKNGDGNNSSGLRVNSHLGFGEMILNGSDGTNNEYMYFTTDSAGSGTARFIISHSYLAKTLLEPTIADGATPYVLDTSLTHTSGSLLDVKNNGTNVFKVYNNGAILTGSGAENYWGGADDIGSINISDKSYGDNGYTEAFWLSIDESGNESFIDAYTSNNPNNYYAQLVLKGSSPTNSSRASIATFHDDAYLDIAIGNSSKTLLNPTIADSSTPYVLDTSLTHTSGSLLDVKNNGTNVVRFLPNGGMYLGVDSEAAWGADNYGEIITYANGIDAYESGIESSSFDGDQFWFSQLMAGYGGSYFSLGSTTNKTEITQDVTGSIIRQTVASVARTLLEPTRSDGSTPYVLDTSLTHTSGNLLTVANNSTNKFAVDFAGAITTGDPGAGTAGWKLGTKVTGATVSLVTTNYVEVNINGSIVKLAIVQ